MSDVFSFRDAQLKELLTAIASLKRGGVNWDVFLNAALGLGVGIALESLKMRLLVPILIFLGISGASAANSNAIENGLELQSACKALTSGVNVAANGLISFPLTYQTGMCWGEFAAIQKVVGFIDENNIAYFGACAPPQSSRLQLIKIVIKYTDEHPEVMHKDFTIIALTALGQAFPCKK